MARCFKCPKVRRLGDPGWHFVELQDSRRLPGPSRLYVCPEDYLDFAVGERSRWSALPDASNGQERLDGNGSAPADANGTAPGSADAPACTADELIAVLAVRGLAGWAFLVRDVAAGRVRRVHLRQLPADPEIRKSLMSYLHSAGAIVTISRSFLSHERRFRQGA